MSDVTERTPLPKLTVVSEDGNWLEVGVSSVSVPGDVPLNLKVVTVSGKAGLALWDLSGKK